MNGPYTPEQIQAYKDDNERRVREAARRGDLFVDGMPLKVTMELTADCNLFCKMCEFPGPREEGRRRGYELDMRREVFEMLAPQVFPHALVVNLSVVGEPLMVPYLDRVLELAREWGTKIEFITNGQMLDRAMIERIAPWTADLIVSFDGGTRRTFNRIRVGADFDLVTRNVLLFERWRRAQPPERFRPALHFGVTLMRENIEELPTIVRVAKLLGVDRVNCAWMIAFSDKMAGSSLFRHGALANACLRRARAVADELGISLVLPAEIPGPGEEEIAAVAVREPELAEGPLPHLRAMLEGGEAPEVVPEPASPDEAYPETAAVEGDGEGPALSEVNAITGSKERAFGSPLQQSADERRQQSQVTACPPPEPRDQGADGLRYAVPAEPDAAEARYTCKFLWNELFISLSGDVAPCCIQGRPVVGNIHHQDLASIWNSPMMQTMRRTLLEGNPIPCCKDCNYNTQLGHGDYREETFFIKLDRIPSKKGTS